MPSRQYLEAEQRLNLPSVSDWGRHNENPPGLSLWGLLREDLQTHGSVFEQGFWAVACNRFGNWRMGKAKIIRAPATLLYNIWFKCVEVFGGITLSYTVKLGRRVHIWHHGGIVIGARYVGNDVHLRQNVTIGVAQTFQTELPIVEDNADIGCGAAILGSIHIGAGAKIAANSLVVSDIPAGVVAIGVPAKVMRIGPPAHVAAKSSAPLAVGAQV